MVRPRDAKPTPPNALWPAALTAATLGHVILGVVLVGLAISGTSGVVCVAGTVVFVAWGLLLLSLASVYLRTNRSAWRSPEVTIAVTMGAISLILLIFWLQTLLTPQIR